jgi:hypothetical protein
MARRPLPLLRPGGTGGLMPADACRAGCAPPPARASLQLPVRNRGSKGSKRPLLPGPGCLQAASSRDSASSRPNQRHSMAGARIWSAGAARPSPTVRWRALLPA